MNCTTQINAQQKNVPDYNTSWVLITYMKDVINVFSIYNTVDPFVLRKSSLLNNGNWTLVSENVHFIKVDFILCFN